MIRRKLLPPFVLAGLWCGLIAGIVVFFIDAEQTYSRVYLAGLCPMVGLLLGCAVQLLVGRAPGDGNR